MSDPVPNGDARSMGRDASFADADPDRPLAIRAEDGAGDAPERLAARLRAGDRPVIGRIREGALILDLRCLSDDGALLAALA